MKKRISTKPEYVDHGPNRGLAGSTARFDSAPCPNATLADLNTGLITSFVALARRVRGFPFSETSAPGDVLAHLGLLQAGCPTNGAVLLFGRKPQRFFSSSVVKCSHHEGNKATKSATSRQIFRGTLFDLVDESVDFVMTRINEDHSKGATTSRPIPQDVVREAIVNAVVHRDYTSEDRVNVTLFGDRLEVRNPGALPPALTIDALRRPHDSFPRNSLLAKCLFLAKYTERIGTGTRDMIMTCRGVGLPVPQFTLEDGFVATFGREPERS